MDFDNNGSIWDRVYYYPHLFVGIMLTAALLLSTGYFVGINVPGLPYFFPDLRIFQKKKCGKKHIRVYMDGHANALRQAKALGNELVVGVVSDEEIIANKGPSVLSMDESNHGGPQLMSHAMVKFLNEIEREKPIRFTHVELRLATNDFRHSLGSGGFGSVYKGTFSDGTIVAVKVLHKLPEKIIEEQFKAEVSTIGKTHHFNVVRLYGFCFESLLKALVYEYMEKGSLDKYLFCDNMILGFEKLHEIAIGTAKGMAYLHEDCPQRIIHYDIKPGNILLDADFSPKVADFGLAKLCNRDRSHITMSGGRGTPGYAAPELWMPFPVTHKCDVYSFGMLLFEIIGRRKNFDTALRKSQEWFPKWVWSKFEKEEMGDLMIACGIEEKDREMAERMAKVALWCVQKKPDLRPLMSMVVKTLEGALETPTPANPFPSSSVELEDTPGQLARMALNGSGFDSVSSHTGTGAIFTNDTPIMRKFEIQIASN